MKFSRGFERWIEFTRLDMNKPYHWTKTEIIHWAEFERAVRYLRSLK